jgi:hypothetical protein
MQTRLSVKAKSGGRHTLHAMSPFGMGVVAPAGTPADIVARMQREIARALGGPAFIPSETGNVDYHLNGIEHLKIAESEPDVRVAVGIHPCDVDSVIGTEWINELRELARHERVAAIGEIGLDYHYHLDTREAQCELFGNMLRLAAEKDLPAIIHTREADDDTLRVLDASGSRARAAGSATARESADRSGAGAPAQGEAAAARGRKTGLQDGKDGKHGQDGIYEAAAVGGGVEGGGAGRAGAV